MKGGPFELLLASPAPLDAEAYTDQIKRACDRFFSWPARPRSIIRRVRALISDLPVSVATDYSAVGCEVVQRQLDDGTDLLLVDFAHTAILLPSWLTLPSIMFAHNVEAEILERHAGLKSGIVHAVWASQAAKMSLFEGAALRRFDRVLAASSRDAEILTQKYNLSDVLPIGTGVDLDFYRYSAPELQHQPSSSAGKIVFVGAMDGAANIDAVMFLIDEIWPFVARARPQAQALIVGRNPPKSLVSRAISRWPNFTFTGSVPDVRPYIIDSNISVIPIRAGSGTRIKAFEAMALGRPVVSTRIGMEGLEATAGRHYLVADDPQSFANSILQLLEDGPRRAHVAQAARAILEQKFSWEIVARRAQEMCLETFERAKALRAIREVRIHVE